LVRTLGGIVFRYARAILVAILIASLATAPAMAAPRPLGNILFAEQTRLGTVSAVAGATVYPGDRIATDARGSVRLRVGAGQVYLLPSSLATLEEYPGGVSATLGRGTLGFASVEESLVVVRAFDALIRPKNSQPTHAQISMVSPGELLVSSYRGSLEVVVGTEVHAVPEGTAYRVMIEPEPPQDPQGAGAKDYKRARVMMYFMGAAIAAAIITFAVLHNLSPSRP
jgi:hypothetical protein